MKTRNVRLKTISFTIFLGMVVFTSACNEKAIAKNDSENQPKAVKLLKVGQMEDMVRTYPGKVQSIQQVAMSFPLGGPVQTLLVKKGERVQAHDVLVRIDPRDFEVQVKTLEAQLAIAQSQLSHAQAEYRRVRGLFEHDNASRSDFDTVQSALDVAQGQVDATAQALKKATLALADTELRAPYDGTVADTFIDSYERVSPFQPVLLFQGVGGLKVVIQVPENEMAKWMAKRQNKFLVSFDVIPDVVVQAVVSEFSTESDPLTQTFAVSLELESPFPDQIIPGMTASVQWPQPDESDSGLKSTIGVPLPMVLTDVSGKTFVWKYEEPTRTLIKQIVQTGSLTDSGMTITKGLNPGDRILSAGVHLAYEGQLVRPMEE